MNTSHRNLPVSSTRIFFLLLTLTLLLPPYVVNADNNNVTNSNAAGNANVNTTTNQNTNTSRNANGNSNQTEAGTSPTPSPSPSPTPNPGMEQRKDALANSTWFVVLVCLMFIGVFGLTGSAIYRAVRYSRTTYNSPLGLPDGSLRAMLAYTLVAFLGFYILAGILTVSDFKPPDFLLGIVATVIGFYFGSRTGEDRGAGARTGAVQGSVTDKTGAAAGAANVELTHSDGKKIALKADAKGKYKFENVAAGDYDIQATLTGHAPSDIAKVKMTAGASQTVNLTLK